MKINSIARTIAKKKWGAIAVLLLVIVFFIFFAHPVNAGGVLSTIFDVAVGGISGTLAIILYPIVTILAGLLGLAGRLVNFALQPQPLITSDFVQAGWVAMRDLGNMLFILVLLGIALDYILFNSVGVKRALPRLLFIALLINFSLPIAGIALDFANIATSFFMDRAGGDHFTETLAQHIGLASVLDMKTATAETKINITPALVANGAFFDTVFSIIFLSGTLFVFFALAILFFIRHFYLSVLLILLPLALTMSILPFLSSHLKKWTSKFFQWTMFAPACAFFLYLSMVFLNSSQLAIIKTNAAGADAGWLATIGTQFTTYIFAWGLMVMSLTVAQSMGIAGAGIAVATFNKGTKWARGKASGAGKSALAAAARRSKAVEGEAGEKGWINKGADFVAKHPVALLGLGKLGLEGGLRAAAVKTKAAIEKHEGLTAKEKEVYMGMSDSMRAQEEKRLKDSRLPGSGATLAHLQSIIAQKGKLNVLDQETGEIDPVKTSARIKEAHENAMKHGLKKVADEIKYSNTTVGLEIETEEWEKKAMKGELAGIVRDASGRMIEATVKATGKTLETALKEFKYMSMDQMKAAKGTWTEKSMAIMTEIGGIDANFLKKAVEVGDIEAVALYNKYLKKLGEGADEERERKTTEFKKLLRKHNPGALSGLASGNFIRFGVVDVPQELLTTAGKKKQAGEWGTTDMEELI